MSMHLITEKKIKLFGIDLIEVRNWKHKEIILCSKCAKSFKKEVQG